MVELFVKGGFTMYPILGISILATVIIVERVLTLLRARTDTESFLARIGAALEAQRYEEALAAARSGRGVMSRILTAGLEKVRKGRAEVEKAIEARGNIEVAKLERGMSALSACSRTAPLLGFLGTVTGMITAFEAMAGAGDPAKVALGIAEALITTAAGLIVAIPISFVQSLFMGRINQFVMEVEEASVRFLDALETSEERQAKKLARDEIGGDYLEV
jgi:biopolymer transport protein ExbB